MQATHYAGGELGRLERVAHNRSALWVAVAVALLGLLLFVAIFNFILPNFGANLEGFALILLGLLFSLVPAALWLIFFYRMDRLEPEPKHMVFNVFLASALVTAALHDPILQGMFTVNEWLYDSWWTHLLGGILLVGFLEQFLIFAVVRYIMFFHHEFDERVDGVIYAVAAGLGLATVLNFQYVLWSGGVDLDIGSIRMVVNALAYASFAGVLGYFLGQARHEKTPFYYLPLGITVAAVFNGLFFYLLNRSFGGGLTSNVWQDLIFATVVAVITLGLVFWLVARANEETLRLAHEAARSGTSDNVSGIPDEVAGAIAGTTAGVVSSSGAVSPPAASSTTPGETSTTSDTSGKEEADYDTSEENL